MRAESAPPPPTDALVREMRLAQQKKPTGNRRLVKGLAWITPAAAAGLGALFLLPQPSLAYSPEKTLQAAQNMMRHERSYWVGEDGKQMLVYEAFGEGDKFVAKTPDGKFTFEGDLLLSYSEKGNYVQVDKCEADPGSQLEEILSTDGATSIKVTKVVKDGKQALQYDVLLDNGKAKAKTIVVDAATRAPIYAVLQSQEKPTLKVAFTANAIDRNQLELTAPSDAAVYDLRKQREEVTKLLSGKPLYTDSGIGLFTIIADERGRMVALMNSDNGEPVKFARAWINGREATLMDSKPKPASKAVKGTLEPIRLVEGIGETVVQGQLIEEKTVKVESLLENYLVTDGTFDVVLVLETLRPNTVFLVWMKPNGGDVPKFVSLKLELLDGSTVTLGDVPVMRTSNIDYLVGGVPGTFSIESLFYREVGLGLEKLEISPSSSSRTGLIEVRPLIDEKKGVFEWVVQGKESGSVEKPKTTKGTLTEKKKSDAPESEELDLEPLF